MSDSSEKKENASNAKKANTFIGDYHEAPNYMKDNQHITHGYRIGFDSPKKIFRSLFMVHNESVNIWSHFLPAIIIFCLSFYLLVFVGPTNIMHDFQIARTKLSKQLDSYSQALNNLTFVVKMKQFKSERSRQVQQVKRSVFNSYTAFQQGLHNWKLNTEAKLQSLQNEVKSSVMNHMAELEVLKQDFQNVFVPYIVNGIIDKINSEHLDSLTLRLQKLKKQIDSQAFNIIQIHPNSVPGPNLHEVSRWPVFVLLFSAVTCLLCSTMFHLFYPMSGKAYQVFSRLDYAGINVLIVGSSFPCIYYGMYCNIQLVIFYLTIISILGLSLFIFSLFQYLHRNQNLNMKALCYGGFGVSLTIPMGHILINGLVFNNYGDTFSSKGSVGYYLLCGFFYLFGLYIYTVRCPERNRPGKFNVCGNSHQIWHVFVLLGIIATYFGAIEDFQTRKYSMCPPV